MQTAYNRGADTALAQFGVKIANARLVGAVAGGLTGAALSREDERAQGGIMGTIGGYALGAGASHLMGKAMPALKDAYGAGADAARGLYDRAASAIRRPAAAPAARMGPASTFAAAPDGFDPFNRIPTPGTPAFDRHVEKTLSSAGLNDTGVTGGIPHMQDEWRTRLTQHYEANQARRALPRPTKAMRPYLQKAAEAGLSMGVPGLGVSLSNKEERLPGMHRWVPRHYIERAYDELESGLDPQAILELEERRGRLLHPMLGAGAGAAATHFGVPGSSPQLKALGALLGAGAGAVYNGATSSDRVGDMTEALRGVMRESGGSALTGRTQHETSREAPPGLVTRGSLS